MKWSHQLTLRRNLLFISLMTTGLALLITGVVMFVTAFSAFRQGIIRDLMIKADIIGDQCTAALMFNSRRDAEEILRSLRADPHIEYAAVYAKSGALFAIYQREKRPPERPAAGPPEDGQVIGIKHVALMHPVMLHGDRIGSVFIRSDLGSLYALLTPYATAAMAALAVSLLIAYVLVSMMQKVITTPVSRLAWLMEHITRDKDFTLRADTSGPGELVSLANGFNDMLATIEDRDRELAQQRSHLEKTVARLEQSTAELEEANVKLKNLDKLKSDFVSTVSHELRTPLTAIKAFVELIIIKPAMPAEKKQKLLQTVNAESDRLGRLINDLLDLSRIEAGILQWRFEDVAMDEIISVSLKGMQPLAHKKGQQIAVTHRDPIPSIRADRDRMIQVITNILSNAVKFTPEQGSIAVETGRSGNPVPEFVIAVKDTGPGIPPDDLEFIFDKFHRAGDQLTTGIEGTGLGLSISRQIVEHHGGRITAMNNPEGGSTFTVILPLP